MHQGKIREARETAAMGRAQASTSNQGGSACLPSHVHASPAMQAALAHMDLQLLPPRRVHCELVCGPHPQKQACGAAGPARVAAGSPQVRAADGQPVPARRKLQAKAGAKSTCVQDTL